MEGSCRCREGALLLQQEFIASRLEKQILMRAFALIVPVDGSEPIGEEPGQAAADQPLVVTVRSQGVPQS